MDTTEHTELGNAVRFEGWDILDSNPYINFDGQGVLLLDLQGIGKNGLPQQINLNKLPAGVIVAMSGDYFGGKEVDFDLPTNIQFTKNHMRYNREDTYENLGSYLIKLPVSTPEAQKLINSYKRLANPEVTQHDIDTIYTIDGAKYIPFFETLNAYTQQLMFALRVKNYGEMLTRNLSHFTPWSVRAYTIGHYIALNYARIAYELTQLLRNPEHQSELDEFNTVREILQNTPDGMSPQFIQDLVYRYQALSLSMEFFCFHYYTDHFAAGHGAFIGDLRAVLPERFGTLGGILVNNLHDELNRVTVYTRKPYDPTPDVNSPPIAAGGDGDFDSPQNYFNHLACLAGMKSSLTDLHYVFQGGKIPKQKEYGGLEYLPDIDKNYRQPQPLIILGKDQKIYYRTQLSKINILSPSQLEATNIAPTQHGYTELSSIWSALLLVIKLRGFSLFYQGTLQPLSAAQLKVIEEEERKLNPNREPIPQLPESVMQKHTTLVPASWKEPVEERKITESLLKHGFLAQTPQKQNKSQELDIEIETNLVM